jgi:hypothetical protein
LVRVPEDPDILTRNCNAAAPDLKKTEPIATKKEETIEAKQQPKTFLKIGHRYPFLETKKKIILLSTGTWIRIDLGLQKWPIN